MKLVIEITSRTTRRTDEWLSHWFDEKRSSATQNRATAMTANEKAPDRMAWSLALSHKGTYQLVHQKPPYFRESVFGSI